MRRIFADTSFLVSFYNQRDKNHKSARHIVKSIDKKRVLWVISDYIFDEFLTVLLVRKNKQFAIEIGKSVMKDPNFNLVKIGEDNFKEAWKLFCKTKKVAGVSQIVLLTSLSET